MELFPPLTGFDKAIADDTRIGATHISIYMALLQQWNLADGNNPVDVSRSVIMKSAKIYGRHTYNQCMNHLHDYGYIIYLPAANGSVMSKVILMCSENDK